MALTARSTSGTIIKGFWHDFSTGRKSLGAWFNVKWSLLVLEYTPVSTNTEKQRSAPSKSSPCLAPILLLIDICI